MTLPVILRPAADADIQAIHDELERSQAGLRGSDRGAGCDARFAGCVRVAVPRLKFLTTQKWFEQLAMT